MKSLEIVNKELAMLKSPMYVVEYERLKKLETIKQDLEVLEIIKRILIKIEYVNYKDKQTHCFVINKFVENKDIEKVKQWLEENEE